MKLSPYRDVTPAFFMSAMNWDSWGVGGRGVESQQACAAGLDQPIQSAVVAAVRMAISVFKIMAIPLVGPVLRH